MPLTVQKQLGLFLKRRCAPDAPGRQRHDRSRLGPPQAVRLPGESHALAGNVITPLMGSLSHQGGCRINTSGLGVLRCSLQGRGAIIPRPLWLPRPPELCLQGRRDYLGLFVYSLSWNQESERQWGGSPGWGWGSWAWLPIHSDFLLPNKGPRPLLEPEPSLSKREGKPREGEMTCSRLRGGRELGGHPAAGLQRRAVWTTPHTTPGSPKQAVLQDDASGLSRNRLPGEAGGGRLGSR